MKGLGLLDQWKLARLIMADPDLPPSSKMIAFFLLDHHNLKTGRCDPSIETLAAETGLSKRQLIRVIKPLLGRYFHVSSSGSKKASKRTTNSYQPNWQLVTSTSPDRCHPSHPSGDMDVNSMVTPVSPKTKNETLKETERETSRSLVLDDCNHKGLRDDTWPRPRSKPHSPHQIKFDAWTIAINRRSN